ncbi:MAG TPA: cytochrome c biogenesis protein CcsA [Anaerolineales bacterium]|nr:cytochrome c biogenesis protein CcsA [Anaerolineales bacterium]
MEPKSNALKILDWTAAALLVVATYLVFFYAPKELVMGNVQRVFYFHVATGWVGFLAFFLTVATGTLVIKDGRGNPRPWLIAGWTGLVVGFLAQGMYRSMDLDIMSWVSILAAMIGLYALVLGYGMRKGRDFQYWDIHSVSLVELGLVFSFINIASGAVWARPIWNTWWTWDPRLVTATIMELIYVAYLMLRAGIDNPVRRARFGAVYAILGFVTVPITFFSIRIWRSIHPVVFGAQNPGAEVDAGMTTGSMYFTFFFALFTFTVLFVDLYLNRIRLGKFAEEVEQLKMKSMI